MISVHIAQDIYCAEMMIVTIVLIKVLLVIQKVKCQNDKN